MNKRIDDEYWMNFARQAGKAGTCRVEVGCALVQQRRIIGLGRVGSVRGDDHCCDVGGCWLKPVQHRGSSDTGLSCVRTVHAEVNAVLNATKIGELDMIFAYSTHAPCFDCLKVLLQFGVGEIVYDKPYKDEWRDEWLRTTPVAVRLRRLGQSA